MIMDDDDAGLNDDDILLPKGDGRNRGRDHKARVSWRTKHLGPMKTKTEGTPS